MAASKPQRKSSVTSTTSAKPLSKAPRKAQAKPVARSGATTKPGSAKSIVLAAARKAVVLGQFEIANGKVYQVLAPAVGPRHLSSEDVQKAVKLMVSAR